MNNIFDFILNAVFHLIFSLISLVFFFGIIALTLILKRWYKVTKIEYYTRIQQEYAVMVTDKKRKFRIGIYIQRKIMYITGIYFTIKSFLLIILAIFMLASVIDLIFIVLKNISPDVGYVIFLKTYIVICLVVGLWLLYAAVKNLLFNANIIMFIVEVICGLYFVYIFYGGIGSDF